MNPTQRLQTPVVQVKPKTDESDAKGLEVVSYIPEHEEEDQQVVHHVVEEAFEHVVSQQGEKL